jgi:hypothetical protein
VDPLRGEEGGTALRGVPANRRHLAAAGLLASIAPSQVRVDNTSAIRESHRSESNSVPVVMNLRALDHLYSW